MHLATILPTLVILFVCATFGRPDAFNVLLAGSVLGTILATTVHPGRERLRRVTRRASAVTTNSRSV